MVTCVDSTAGKEVITTDGKALGPYSQAVKAGNTLYVSGQIGLKPGVRRQMT